MSDFEDLLDEVARLRRDHEGLNIRFDNLFSQGRVTDVDHEKGARIGLDQDGKHKSDWSQPADFTGRTRVLPREGEQALILHPHGDKRQGVLLGLGHHDKAKNPAKDAKNTVLHDLDGVRIEATGDGGALITAKTITFKSGGVTVTITDGGVAIKGGRVDHNDINIGSDHKHKDVEPGVGKTGTPET